MAVDWVEPVLADLEKFVEENGLKNSAQRLRKAREAFEKDLEATSQRRINDGERLVD